MKLLKWLKTKVKSILYRYIEEKLERDIAYSIAFLGESYVMQNGKIEALNKVKEKIKELKEKDKT